MHQHHFATEEDVAEEFFALLSKAREHYLQDVVTDGKRYDRYVDDFVNGHRYIDCDNAVCRNCHEMNIHIVKGLLTDCAHLVESLFTAAPFSLEECMELKRMYDTSESLPITGKHRIYKPNDAPPLSFGSHFTREQMVGIVSCANTYHLFCTPICIEDMEALFACKEGFHIRVNNIRHVVVLFDALLENSLILSRWQAVLAKGRFLQSKDGERFVSASSLSSALSAVRNNMTSVALGIREAIRRLKE
ncbi:hypothetical protein [Bacteroides hominis]|uniref:hypothetical protein n=1 Tax=Bacteroides hominis TaxID=2763023 RepID=UPI001C9AFE84|nr:hypothetical protein [Bacteroides hominis (ex Liu et al. 2022)]